jgi:hypothetical protein
LAHLRRAVETYADVVATAYAPKMPTKSQQFRRKTRALSQFIARVRFL